MKIIKNLIVFAFLNFVFLANFSYAQDDNQNVFSWGNLIIVDSPNVTIEEYPEVKIYTIDNVEYPLWTDADIHSGTAVFLDQNRNLYRNRAGLRYFPVLFQGDNFFVDKVDGFVTSNNVKFTPVTLQLETSLVPGKYLFWLREDVKETFYYFEK
jgi:hypothetical protein